MTHNVTFINDECVYFNYKFWKDEITNTEDFYNNNNIQDNVKSSIEYEKFDAQYSELHQQAEDLINDFTVANQVQYNINVGHEFIALFREEFVKTPLSEISSLEIAQKTASLIPLILTGSFREVCVLLSTLETDEFLTTERIQKYIQMLTTADAIEYDSIAE